MANSSTRSRSSSTTSRNDVAEKSSAESEPGTKKQAGAKPTALARGRGDDVALICGKTADGRGLQILRKRRDRLEAGVVTPVEEGKPLSGELVTLKPRGQSPLCDVEVHYAPTAERESNELSGPAQVATETYRQNWDTIWSRRKRKPSDEKLLLN